MRELQYTPAEVDAAAAARPAGYRDDLMRALVKRDADWITFDADHPAYAELQERHKTDTKIPVKRRRTVELDPGNLTPAAMPDPKVWGPKRWAELHAFALTATPGELAEYLKYFRVRVPCGTCRGHLTAFLRANPPGQAPDPFAWSVDLHNTVNAKIGKPTITVEQARARWL